MKILVNTSRFLVGILFIFSGLIKANDPLGLSYKMQEFFESWNMPGWEHYTLSLSLVIIVFEILAGVAVLLGWKMKLFSWLLLLLIIFFTFLTAYALFSGKIKECGCFGNCIPLTAGQSFGKDIFLLVLIVFLFIFRKNIRPVLPDSANLLILFFTLVFSFLSNGMFCISFRWWTAFHTALERISMKTGNLLPVPLQIAQSSHSYTIKMERMLNSPQHIFLQILMTRIILSDAMIS